MTCAATAEDGSQRVSLFLDDSSSGQEGDRSLNFCRVERTAAEKVKIDGLAMSQLQRNRRTSVQSKLRRHLPEFSPQLALRRREDFQMRWESVHAQDQSGASLTTLYCNSRPANPSRGLKTFPRKRHTPRQAGRRGYSLNKK
jgi:hypothetical protein